MKGPGGNAPVILQKIPDSGTDGDWAIGLVDSKTEARLVPANSEAKLAEPIKTFWALTGKPDKTAQTVTTKQTDPANLFIEAIL
jgi:hypothetical protein